MLARRTVTSSSDRLAMPVKLGGESMRCRSSKIPRFIPRTNGTPLNQADFSKRVFLLFGTFSTSRDRKYRSDPSVASAVASNPKIWLDHECRPSSAIAFLDQDHRLYPSTYYHKGVAIAAHPTNRPGWPLRARAREVPAPSADTDHVGVDESIVSAALNKVRA